MALGVPLYFVRPDENWVAQGSIFATSEQEGYEAIFAKSLKPDHPWWANSNTATLTSNFGFGTFEVGVVALINNNADDAKAITVSGVTGITTLIAAREASGYPKDIAQIVDPAALAGGVQVSIAGNANKWSVGQLVAGKLRSIHNFLDTSSPNTEVWRGQEVDPGIPTYGSDDRYDVGVEHGKVEGEILCETTADFIELHDWYSSTRMGFYPTLIIFDLNRYPPMFARMGMGKRTMKEGMISVPVVFVTMGRGLEVVDQAGIEVEILP